MTGRQAAITALSLIVILVLIVLGFTVHFVLSLGCRVAIAVLAGVKFRPHHLTGKKGKGHLSGYPRCYW